MSLTSSPPTNGRSYGPPPIPDDQCVALTLGKTRCTNRKTSPFYENGGPAILAELCTQHRKKYLKNSDSVAFAVDDEVPAEAMDIADDPASFVEPPPPSPTDPAAYDDGLHQPATAHPPSDRRRSIEPPPAAPYRSHTPEPFADVLDREESAGYGAEELTRLVLEQGELIRDYFSSTTKQLDAVQKSQRSNQKDTIDKLVGIGGQQRTDHNDTAKQLDAVQETQRSNQYYTTKSLCGISSTIAESSQQASREGDDARSKRRKDLAQRFGLQKQILENELAECVEALGETLQLGE